MLRCFLYLVSHLTYAGGQEYSQPSELCLKSGQILLLYVSAFYHSTGQIPLCPTLFFPKLPMEVTHDQEICQAKLNNKKLFCYNIVSALGSLFVCLFYFVFLLKCGYVAFKADFVTKATSVFTAIKGEKLLYTEDNKSMLECGGSMFFFISSLKMMFG